MNYEDLLNLPTLNGVTIIGNRMIEHFGFVPMSSHEIVEIELEVFGYVL